MEIEPKEPKPRDGPLDGAQIDATARRLEKMARAVIFRRGIPPRADIQPESVAYSVIAGALHTPPAANDNEHLLAILNAAIEHKIIDRLRRGGREGPERSCADLGSSELPDAVSTDAAPDEATQRREDEAGVDRFRAIGSRAVESKRTWELLDLHLLRGTSLGEAAAAIGLTRDAAKMRYHAAKRPVVVLLLAPVFSSVPRADAALGKSILVDRLPLAAAAAALGLTEDEARRRVDETIVPAMVAAYGRPGAAAIAALTKLRSA